MKRTTMALPDVIFDALERQARRENTSVSGVARRMLASQLGLAEKGERELPFADLGRSGHSHSARQMEDLLVEAWSPDRDR